MPMHGLLEGQVRMRIHRVVNNNICRVLGPDGNEMIVTGRGIGFKRHAGDDIPDSVIEQTFVLSRQKDDLAFAHRLLDEVTPNEMQASVDILKDGREHLNQKLSDGALITLCDHIHTAVARMREGMVVRNVLLWEIRRFYPDEYAVGARALDTILAETGVQLPEDEAGFIALNLVNAELGPNAGDAYGITRLMQGMLDVIRYTCKVPFDTSSMHYTRFLTHLRFFAQRIVTNTPDDSVMSDEFARRIAEAYPQAAASVDRVEDYLRQHYHHDISAGEKAFLTIHVANLIRASIASAAGDGDQGEGRGKE